MLCAIAMATQSNQSWARVSLILCAIAVILCAGIIYRHSTAVGEKQRNVAAVHHFSNEWVQISKKLDEQKLVNLTLEHQYADQTELLLGCSNKVASVSTELSKAQSEANQIATSSHQHLEQQDTRIAELEQQRTGLTKSVNELSDSIDDLQAQITEAERKLAASEGEREQLLAEVKHLRAEKAELEKQFNSLIALRKQVRKLRDELAGSRRLDWIRRGLYGNFKASEGKMLASAAPVRTDYNLDVELHQNGRAAVTTSSPAAGH
jgi:DNA repair exonuclease SbcCD ATPase subunit